MRADVWPRAMRAALVASLILGICCTVTSRAAAQREEDVIDVKAFGATGSDFETIATTVAGKRTINVADVGDFRPGQEVMVAGASVRYDQASIYGPGNPYPSERPLSGEIEMRGFTGSEGGWIVYLVEIDGTDPLTFRWSDDLARSWGGVKVPVTFDWQPLSRGTEIRFVSRGLAPGNMISFHARSELVTTVEAVHGGSLTLKDAPNRSLAAAAVCHADGSALQDAIDEAIKEKRRVFFPAGHYRLTRGLVVRDASIEIEGENGDETLLDISHGLGYCFELRGGGEVTIRNFRMVGHTGRDDEPGDFATSSGFRFWASALKRCGAVHIENTERVLVENVHASKMSAEAFYSQGAFREGSKVPSAYTKAITYLRCTADDCAANAFNNNDMAENTSVLYCRIENCAREGWHAWEGPSRFIRIIGNYVRNSGPVTIGDQSHRYEHLNDLGCGQAIVSDNVFEGIGRSEGVLVEHGPSQVVVSNNLFINYTGPAVRVMGETDSYPTRSVTVIGNNIDMLRDLTDQSYRVGIRVGGASDVIVSDNQIRVRGQYDPRVIGVIVDEPSVNVDVHDNLIENCGYGIWARRAASAVREVVDDRTFRDARLPREWPTSHLYRGWKVAWLKDGEWTGETSTIESFDPQAEVFRLVRPRHMEAGDRFEIIPGQNTNWNIHDNTITGCVQPVVLEAYGSRTARFANNTVSRGGAAGVRRAIDVSGRFDLIGNTVSGFDEGDSAALSLRPGRLGDVVPNIIRSNIFNHCSRGVEEERPGLWDACVTGENVFVECGETALAKGAAQDQGTAP